MLLSLSRFESTASSPKMQCRHALEFLREMPFASLDCLILFCEAVLRLSCLSRWKINGNLLFSPPIVSVVVDIAASQRSACSDRSN